MRSIDDEGGADLYHFPVHSECNHAKRMNTHSRDRERGRALKRNDDDDNERNDENLQKFNRVVEIYDDDESKRNASGIFLLSSVHCIHVLYVH